ncbi:hypothetical protein VA602_00665 [Pseudomonas sp. MH2]|uniref:Glycosyltransferase RgtA/B/C/D-like domain-containing protein n=1 Tax=Pseudomonas machongensis TaxID=3110229 RepID=A0ABU5VBK8_9PSED|nr:hypothetical protein [Pseudomonas sp. MH2]MEA5669845.1 hypothetical protein [Pseudomonas sp. MH2]
MIYMLVFAAIVVAKILVYLVLLFHPGMLDVGGNDSVYYDAYAQGANLAASSAWPEILRGLHDVGLYSREGVSFFLMLLSAILIPVLVARLSLMSRHWRDQRVGWMVLLIVSLYPTIFYYALDIYRDVLMLFVFVVGLFCVRSSVSSESQAVRLVAFLMAFIVAASLFGLRAYLGVAFALSLVVFHFFKFQRFSLVFHVVPLLLVLNGLFAVGLLRPLMQYRALFNNVEGGTNLGIRFDSVYYFIPDYLHSFFSQMLGLFFPGPLAVLFFIMESLPVIFALMYLFKNRKYASRFVDFIVVFFFAYSTIWLLGNDNLGTAIRLRIYNYICVVIACALVYQAKQRALARHSSAQEQATPVPFGSRLYKDLQK